MNFPSSDSLADRDAPPRALVEALREEPIDVVRMQNAYLRFLQKRAAAPSWWRAPRVARWAALAVVVGVSSAYAANLIKPFGSKPLVTDSAAPALIRTTVPRATKGRARPHADAVPEAQAVPEAAAGPDGALVPEADTGPTGAVHDQPSRSVAPVPSAEQWKRAARGLRDGDLESANAALRELTRRGTEADRESALLVQAQVLLAQGREAEAGTLLKSLEASAHAPSVRRKSAELLARLRDRPAQRSVKSRAGTDVP